MQTTKFRKAQAVWAEGLEETMNLTCRFEGAFTGLPHASTLLRVAAATIYRVWLNGSLAGYGPARCAHGYYRVDEWTLTSGSSCNNTVVIEVAGYNVNSYAYLDQPSFLQAEVEVDGVVVLHTAGEGGFTGYIDDTRLQRAQRYSFQRAFTEAYVMPAKSGAGRRPVRLSPQPEKRLLFRGVPLPVFTTQSATTLVGRGKVAHAENPKGPFLDRATMEISSVIKGFMPDDLDAFLTEDARWMTFGFDSEKEVLQNTSALEPDSFALYSFKRNLTGFISLKVQVNAPCCLYLFFDERLTEGDVDYMRTKSVNIVRYQLEVGAYRLLTIEPYTLKYLKVVCMGGAIETAVPDIVEYKANLSLRLRPDLSDNRLSVVYDAAVETLLQNSVDIFMDCPSRERAGWLCDSYFTAKGEHSITGQNVIERNFLENILLPDSFEHLPAGMFPMCYPADHKNGNYIPNWAMWLVLELEDYVRRTKDCDLVAAFKPKIIMLLDYLWRYENRDGLLENLDGWVFIDWSRANDADLVCGVNYPSNMLYARMLQAAASLYQDQSLSDKANKIHAIIREQSFNGHCFVDNAVRCGNNLVPGVTATEACQNYAFFCGTATPRLYPALWESFLAKPINGGIQGESGLLSSANAFIGLYVRLAALSAHKAWSQIEEEILSIFYPQAKQTGTLWELVTDAGSMNHGFASYAAELVWEVIAHKKTA